MPQSENDIDTVFEDCEGMAYSQCGSLIALLTTKSCINIYCMIKRKLIQKIVVDDKRPISISFSTREHRLLAICYSNNSIEIIDYTESEPKPKFLIDNIVQLRSACITVTGNVFRNQNIELAKKKYIMEWSFDGRYLACYIKCQTGVNDGDFAIYETSKFRRVIGLSNSQKYGVSCIKFTKDNTYLLLGLKNGSILVYMIDYCVKVKVIPADNCFKMNNVTTYRGFTSILDNPKKSEVLSKTKENSFL